TLESSSLSDATKDLLWPWCNWFSTLHCECRDDGSTPQATPDHFRFLIADFRLMLSDQDRRQRRKTCAQIGNRQLEIKNVRNCGREVRHLIVDQADDGSSPFSSANS